MPEWTQADLSVLIHIRLGVGLLIFMSKQTAQDCDTSLLLQ
jgi:hypothetical protein